MLQSQVLLSAGAAARLRICLVYPNCYRIGMSNLGFQAVYAMLNSYAGILCERAFLPDPDELREYDSSRTPLLSLETQQPVSGFDVIAFSVSFESDYLHIPAIFRLAGLPCYAADRTEKQPFVIAGGAAVFINPQPIADFIDAICIGEAEVILPQLLEKLSAADAGREELCRQLATIPGLYLPALCSQDGGHSVERVFLKDLDAHPVATVIQDGGVGVFRYASCRTDPRLPEGVQVLCSRFYLSPLQATLF